MAGGGEPRGACGSEHIGKCSLAASKEGISTPESGNLKMSVSENVVPLTLAALTTYASTGHPKPQPESGGIVRSA